MQAFTLIDQGGSVNSEEKSVEIIIYMFLKYISICVRKEVLRKFLKK